MGDAILAQTVYECLFLFDANKYARDAGGVASTVEGVITKHGGEILASRLWKEDKLAYIVNGSRKGAYWLTYFRIESTSIAAFNRDCEINEDIMRHMVLKLDPRLVDPLVAHARGEVVAEPEAEAASDDSGNGKESGDAVSSETKSDSGTPVG